LLEAFRASRPRVAPRRISGAVREQVWATSGMGRRTNPSKRLLPYSNREIQYRRRLGDGDLAGHPAPQQPHALQARKAAHRGVDLARHRFAPGAGEEIAGEETRLLRGCDTPPHRRPEALDDQTGEACRARTDEPTRRLTEIEVEVPRLVPHDAGEKLAQNRMAGDR